MINPKVINKVKNTHDNHKLKEKESTLDEDDKIIQNNIDEQNINQKQIFIFILFGLLLIIIIYIFFVRTNNYLTPTGGVTKKLFENIRYEQTKKENIDGIGHSIFFTCAFSKNLAQYIDTKLKKENKQLLKSSSFLYFNCYIGEFSSPYESRAVFVDIGNNNNSSELKFFIHLYYVLNNKHQEKMVLLELPLDSLNYSSVNRFDIFSRFETTDTLKKVIKEQLLKDLKKTLDEISDEIKDEDVVINSNFYNEFDINKFELKKRVEVNLDN